MKTRCARCDYVFDSQEAPGLEAACPQCLAASVAALPEDDLLKPGAMFRGLEIKGPLGRGGMGVVYKARQIELGRIVALKVLDPRLAGDPDFIQRFGREARALAALDHPHIVRIHEFGREGDQLFLTMEYVDGVSLRALMRERRLTPAEALAIVPQICEGLECAHSMGVIHRDIKPENILVDREGRVKIADFGLAKMLRQDDAVATRTHITMGTPAYMAPEQYESLKGVDHRADIYALGVVFYEMLTGELPVGRFDPPSVRVQVDVRLDEIVLKALEKRLDRRYQRAAEVKTDLETVASGCARRVVVGRKGVAVMAVTLCLLGVLGVFVPWGQEDPASRIDRVLARLGGGDLEEREAASKELIEMGVGDRGVLARLEKLRDGATDPEVRGRLEGVIREVDYESARRVRLVPQSWIHGHGQSEPRKLALSGDGKRLVTWGDDRRLVMMAASDLRELGVLGTTEKEVKALCFDPAGVHLAVAEESAVRILEVATGKAVATISQEEVSAICYSRDGERIFVASRKGLHAWNPRTGVRERELTGSCVGDVVVSADGKAIVAQGVDGTVWRWSMSDWEEETLLAGDGDITSKVFPWNIALSPDGRHLAQLRKMSGTGSFSGDLVVWDLTTTLPVERLRMPSDEMGLFGPIRSGRDHFVVGGAFEAPVFAWKDLRKVCSVPDGALGTILAPDDGCLFAAVMGEVRRIEFPSGRVLCAKQPHRGQVSAATFHPDGKKVLTGGFDKLIRVWGIEQGNEIGAFERPKGLPGKIAVSHDLSWVALPSLIGSADDSVTGSVSVYDLAERRVVRSSKVRGEFVVGLCLTANRKVLLGHTDGAVSIVDVENGTVEEPVQGDVVFAFGFAFSGDGRFVARAVTDQFTVEVCEISSGKRVFRCKARVHGPVGLSADGRRLYYINEGRMLAMADVVSGDAIASVELPERVDAIAVDPSGRYVGIVCPTKLVVVHAPSLRPVREHEVANMKNLEFSHDGAQILIQGPSSVLVMRITPER